MYTWDALCSETSLHHNVEVYVIEREIWKSEWLRSRRRFLLLLLPFQNTLTHTSCLPPSGTHHTDHTGEHAQHIKVGRADACTPPRPRVCGWLDHMLHTAHCMLHVLFEGTVNTLTLNPKTEHASQHIGVRDESSSKTLVHLLHLSTGAGRPVLTDYHSQW